jgi:hypothetical protein
MTLSELQAAIVALINAEPWFATAGFEALSDDTADIVTEMEKRLAQQGGRGASILVSVSDFDSESSSSKAPIGTQKLACAVSENPALNRFNKQFAPAFQAAEYLAVYLNNQQVGEDTLVCEAIRSAPIPGLINYNVIFGIQHTLEAIPTEGE